MMWQKYHILAVVVVISSITNVDEDITVISVKNGVVNGDIRMDGKTVFITGGNSGLGYESAKDLARRGARVIIACRNKLKAQFAKEEIEKEVKNAQIVITELDLSSLKSIRNCAAETLKRESRLDVLINNAGIMMVPYQKTKDGFESQLGVNHIGHFLLTNLLLPLLKQSAPSRIVVLSSIAHLFTTMNWEDLMSTKSYSPRLAYNQSKLANILFARELSRRLNGTGVTCNSVHPGTVNTKLFDNAPIAYGGIIGRFLSLIIYFSKKTILIDPVEGAQTQIYCAVAPELKGVTGKYFAKCKVTNESIAAKNDDSAKKLWDITKKLVSLGITV